MGTSPDLVVAQARAALLDSFGWIDGHADVWRVFRRPEALAAVVRGLAAPFATCGVNSVIGVEARGFLLGAAVAVELRAGFVAVRKTGALFPGATVRRTTATPDYRGNSHELRLRPDDLQPTDRILLVDDWIETGTQAQTVISMARAYAVTVVGISVMVDELDPTNRGQFPSLKALVTGDQLSNSQKLIDGQSFS
jgi:adenine phosphoribosyltransferase